LVAVCGGFIFGAGGGATGLATFVRSTAFGRWKPARFGEKSGMPRGDFFFIGRPGLGFDSAHAKLLRNGARLYGLLLPEQENIAMSMS